MRYPELLSAGLCQHNPIVVELDEFSFYVIRDPVDLRGRQAIGGSAQFFFAKDDRALRPCRRSHQLAILAHRLLAVLRPVRVRAPTHGAYDHEQEQRPPAESKPSFAIFGHEKIVANARYNRSDPCD